MSVVNLEQRTLLTTADGHAVDNAPKS